MEAAQKYEICVTALREYVVQAGFTDVLIGLSGGIDSSLVATMCVDAFGAAQVHGALLPGPYSSDHSLSDAHELAHNLQIDTDTISIVEPYEAFRKALSGALPDGLAGVAAENTQARCRMVCLMALSNQQQWLLINTGNKSEAMMGYSTLYGDTAGAFAPLGGLYKTDVFALSKWRNTHAEEQGSGAPIPYNVLVKPPSAELSPDQEDERAMGVSYEDLDAILQGLIEEERSAEEVIAQGFSPEQVASVQAKIAASAFKRALEPPYPSARFY